MGGRRHGLSLVISCALLLSGLAVSAASLPSRAISARGVALAVHPYTLPLSFEPNRGQVASPVRFLAHAGSATLYLTAGGMVLDLHRPATSGKHSALRHLGHAPVFAGLTPRLPRSGTGPGASRSFIRLRFDGSNPSPTFAPEGRLEGTVSYFLGANPRSWHTDIPTYRAVVERNVYPGIDLRYRTAAAGGGLEYDWLVRPGASPGRIHMQLEGSGSVHLTAGGDLRIGSGSASLVESAPRIYQLTSAGPRFVGGGFAVHGRDIGFRIGRHDAHRTLVIDPKLSYSTYLGGSESEQGLAIAADSAGDAYVAGSTMSDDFPTSNAVQSDNRGDDNVFLGKFNHSGTGLVYSTYIGGSDSDEALAIRVDRSGNAYLTGDTQSDDFPIAHALQSVNRSTCTLNGFRAPCTDAFITKVGPKGNSLIYSTYLGGNNDDEGDGIAIDAAGNVYVAGKTNSTNFPTRNPLQGHDRTALCDNDGHTDACSDAFVAKLNPSGSQLVYSTYLGGSSNDEANGLAIDRHGDVYICGDTTSSNFPTVNAVQKGPAHMSDAFLAALNPTGTRLIYSTYLRGGKDDMAINIAVRSRSAYVTGFTWSADFPVTAGAVDRTPRALDAFVTKFTPTGAIAYSTRLGGSKNDEAFGIAVDAQGRASITGDTSSRDFPTQLPAQPAFGGKTDAFVTELNPQGTGLVQSSYFGGSDLDFGHDIGLDPAGNEYVIGFTYSRNFPTLHAFRREDGSEDAFVLRLGNKAETPKHHG